MKEGVLVIDKPSGPTSHDMVAAARKVTAVKRIGHLGTLDPLATGVLPLCIGKATRLSKYLSEGSKTYDAEVRFGFSTDTGDSTGVATSPPVEVDLMPAEIAPLLASLLGTVLQKPPRFSAKKVGGVPLYKYARRGQNVEAPPRKITIYENTLLGCEKSVCRLRIRCGPGTYIRSIAVDLGEALGCGAHLSALRRTVSGEFDLSQSVGPEVLRPPIDADRLWDRVIPLEALLRHYPKVTLTPEGAVRVRNGGAVGPEQIVTQNRQRLRGVESGYVRLFTDDDVLLAVGVVESTPDETDRSNRHRPGTTIRPQTVIR